MKKPLALLGILVLGSGVVGLMLWPESRGCPGSLWINRNYIVHFTWDNGVKGITIVDDATGEPELDRELRDLAHRESQQVIPQIVAPTQLERARGQFRLIVQGCEKPYLLRWSDADIPELGEFMAAAQVWDLQTIRELLSKGMNVNAREIVPSTSATALMYAAADEVKHLDAATLSKLRRPPDSHTVEALLAEGADPNLKGVYGTTALMVADRSQVEILLKYGADVDAADNYGKTALVSAIERHDLKTVKLLLEAHANLNVRDKEGWTPLMYAADEGLVETTKLLLASGADPNAKSNANETALSVASNKAKSSSRFKQIVHILSDASGRGRGPGL